MSDNLPDELTRRFPYLKATGAGRATSEEPTEEEVDASPAFGYLRGTKDRALAVEFRFRDGNSEVFPYSHLAGWRFDPSVGLLLKFTADIVSLILVRGSNLDAPVNASGVNLLDRGLQRHRVVWVREMDRAAVKAVGVRGPTIDAITVAECESQDEQRAWVEKTAPGFLR
ncbi:hypothetical protein [Fimbriiglobus ruber]|uniref:Uncharacterized protein n=1 Tax=Fimbriiglobus ruber TaxID=1908690 RepID=A0A225CZX5_9BACT|nr:hypothetical protein [Fimbriiglobus ruber]OWK34910.1 hypothetical protein FRUB_09752 [Fimbriiglobus ruber]